MTGAWAGIMPEGAVALELKLPAAATRRVARVLGLKGRRGRACAFSWHDGPDFAALAAGLALVRCESGEKRGRWRVFGLRRWIGAPGEPRSEAGEPELIAEDLSRELLARLRPVATFAGTWRGLCGEAEGLAPGVVIEVLTGRISADGRETACGRVRLAGPAASVAAAARRLAEALPVEAAGRALAEEALALAGAPELPEAPGRAGASVGESFLRLLASLAAEMVLLASGIDLQDEEPVHRMRVAARRLRSALSLFRRAAKGAELEKVGRELGELGALLAPAREWDVFLGTIGAELVTARPDDPGVARLLAAAERRRRKVYEGLTAYLAGPRFRTLGVDLALLVACRPWEREEGAARGRLDAPVGDFARHVLARRFRPLMAAARGGGKGEVARWPAGELHALRLKGKRMRYAAEFFAPLFPGAATRRMLRRLAELQEALGRLNDGAGSAALLGELGLAEGYGGGLVAGFVAADAVRARAAIAHAWRRVHAAEAFWR